MGIEIVILIIVVGIAMHLSGIGASNPEAEAAASRVKARAEEEKKYGPAKMAAIAEYDRKEPPWPREYSTEHTEECKLLNMEVAAKHGFNRIGYDMVPISKEEQDAALAEVAALKEKKNRAELIEMRFRSYMNRCGFTTWGKKEEELNLYDKAAQMEDARRRTIELGRALDDGLPEVAERIANNIRNSQKFYAQAPAKEDAACQKGLDYLRARG